MPSVCTQTSSCRQNTQIATVKVDAVRHRDVCGTAEHKVVMTVCSICTDNGTKQSCYFVTYSFTFMHSVGATLDGDLRRLELQVGVGVCGCVCVCVCVCVLAGGVGKKSPVATDVP